MKNYIKTISINNLDYHTVSDRNSDQGCQGCAFIDDDGCAQANGIVDCDSNSITFRRVVQQKNSAQTKPQVHLQLELDLTQAILPVFFTVKGLKVQSLDTALKNQSDAYTVSVKDLPQETLEVLAEELKREFIKRNTNVK